MKTTEEADKETKLLELANKAQMFHVALKRIENNTNKKLKLC